VKTVPDRRPERTRHRHSTRSAALISTSAISVADRPRPVSFTFAAQLADRFRRGNVFIVGDAAHRVTPRGGTGMNTAIHDGYDLGWKLAWVLTGWAEPSLLDSYESERRRRVQRAPFGATGRFVPRRCTGAAC